MKSTLSRCWWRESSWWRQRQCRLPRSRTDDTGSTDVLPMRTGPAGITCWDRADAHQSTSVFEWFNCSRLAFVHWDTSSTQAETLWTRSLAWEGWQNPHIWVSSAYACGMRSWRLISCRRSAVYRRNKIGPRTEPCGTPYSSSDGVELDVVDRTCCTRPCRYDLNHVKCL